MEFNFDNKYENESLIDNEFFNSLDKDNLDIDTPIGWSSICFNETINYYTDCNLKISNIYSE